MKTSLFHIYYRIHAGILFLYGHSLRCAIRNEAVTGSLFHPPAAVGDILFVIQSDDYSQKLKGPESMWRKLPLQ